MSVGFLILTLIAFLHLKFILALVFFIATFVFFSYLITRNATRDELKEAFEAGQEYQAYRENANLEEKSWEYTFEKWYERNKKI